MTKTHLLGPSLNCLRQAWFGEYADRLIAIRYDSLVSRPAEVIRELYRLLDENPVDHDFANVQHEEVAFDALIGMPGMHTVSGTVELRPRTTILPPELFAQNDRCFWEMPGQNPRGVTIL
jgi:sulfotransferase